MQISIASAWTGSESSIWDFDTEHPPKVVRKVSQTVSLLKRASPATKAASICLPHTPARTATTMRWILIWIQFESQIWILELYVNKGASLNRLHTAKVTEGTTVNGTGAYRSSETS